MRKNLWRWRSVPGLLQSVPGGNGWILEWWKTWDLKKICCNCRWHEEYTWVCFNGLSLNCTDVTDVEDSCEHWEKRTDENGIEDYEVN